MGGSHFNVSKIFSDAQLPFGRPEIKKNVFDPLPAAPLGSLKQNRFHFFAKSSKIRSFLI
jgi:hypothetical protein